MIDTAATARLAEFFAEIKDLAQFMDCDEVNVHTVAFRARRRLRSPSCGMTFRIVTDLLDAGADLNLPGEDGYTPLHHAASHGHLEIIGLLLCHGALTTLVDIDGRTPADIARILNHDEAYALPSSNA